MEVNFRCCTFTVLINEINKNMTIQTFDRSNLKTMRAEMDAALKTISEKYGVNFELGNIKFSSNEFSLKLSASIGNAKVENKAEKLEANFKLYAKFYGLVPEDFNRKFTHRGTEYKIVGFDTKKRKNNIILERTSDGKSFMGSPEMITKVIK